MMRMLLPWVRQRHETERMREQLAADEEATREARERTNAARMQAAQADRASKKLMRQVELNGWTELLQAAWGRRA